MNNNESVEKKIEKKGTIEKRKFDWRNVAKVHTQRIPLRYRATIHCTTRTALASLSFGRYSCLLGTGSAVLPWTSPAQAFPLGRANNSEETAVIKTPTKRRHYCNRSENSNSKNTQNFVWLILGCITSGTIFLWSIHHFVLLANDDFCDRFIIWFCDNFVNEGMREKCRHSLTASKSEKDAVTRSDRPADLHTQRTSRESSDSTSDSASDSASDSTAESASESGYFLSM